MFNWYKVFGQSVFIYSAQWGKMYSGMFCYNARGWRSTHSHRSFIILFHVLWWSGLIQQLVCSATTDWIYQNSPDGRGRMRMSVWDFGTPMPNARMRRGGGAANVLFLCYSLLDTVRKESLKCTHRETCLVHVATSTSTVTNYIPLNSAA